MSVNPEEPYQDLPPLPPARELQTGQVVNRVISASRALATANASAKRLPDPSILIHAIPLLEAKASSEIENIVTTNDELFRAAHNVEPASPAAREALRYREALYEGYSYIEKHPFSVNLAKIVCSKIIGFATDIRALPGTFIGNPATREHVYTPPQGKETILEHLSRWEVFAHERESGLDPLVKMALLHYQFEAIHPFSDGNGRTGRILNVLYLVQSGLLDQPITYLSGYIVEHKDEYYRLLNGVTQKAAWGEWIEFILNAVDVTSRWTDSLITSIYNLLDQTISELNQTNLPARDLAFLLFSKPYLRYADLVSGLQVSRPTAAKWASSLSEMGMIERIKAGKSVILINHRYLDILFTTPLPK